jgi:uncharacterized protein YciW
MSEWASVLVALISAAGVGVAAFIASHAQTASNALRASLDASTAQNAAQAALYDGYGDLSGHYRTRLGDLDARCGDRGARDRRRPAHHRSGRLRPELAGLGVSTT